MTTTATAPAAPQQVNGPTPPPAAPPTSDGSKLNGASSPVSATEPAAEEVKAPSVAEDPKFAARFASLSRQQNKLRKDQDALREKLTTADEYVALREQAKQNPRIILEKFGVSYEDLTKAILAGENVPEEDRLATIEERLNEQEEQRKQEKVQAEESLLNEEKAIVQKAVDHYKTEVTTFINAHPDDYKLIVVHAAQEDIYSVVEEYFVQTGKILEPKIAADYVEQELREHAKKQAEALGYAPPQQPPPNGAPRDSQPAARDIRPAPTLTNSAASPAAAPPRRMTEDERLAHAASFLRSKPNP